MNHLPLTWTDCLPHLNGVMDWSAALSADTLILKSFTYISYNKCQSFHCWRAVHGTVLMGNQKSVILVLLKHRIVCSRRPTATAGGCICVITNSFELKKKTQFHHCWSSWVPHFVDISARLFTHDQNVAPVMSPTQQAKPQSSLQIAGLVEDLPGVCTDMDLYKYIHLHCSSTGFPVKTLHLT